MDALYVAQAQYAQELQNIRVGLDSLDLPFDPRPYLGAIDYDYTSALDQACALQELYSTPRPKKNEVDQDSQSPLYKTNEFRIFHFKVWLRECLIYYYKYELLLLL